MGVHVSIDLTGAIAAHVLEETGEGGSYADPADYIRDLIRKDMAAVEQYEVRTLKEHLQEAFAAPESDSIEMDADAFFRWVKSQPE